MRSKSLWLTALALMPVLASPVWSAPRTVGDEILVNSNLESKQRNPVAAFHPSGRYLVVWENDKNGLRARFFSRDGQPTSNELGLVANQVPASVPFFGDVAVRKDPALALLPSGDFFLFWTEEKAHLRTDIFYESRTVLDQDVFGQRFESDGRSSGPAFRVSETATGNQARPKALVLPGGRVLVVWEGTGVYGRVLSRGGQFLSDEVKVADFHRLAGNAAPAVSASGDVLVAWETNDGNRQGVFARRFDRDFAPIGAEFRINTDTVGIQRRPAVAAAPNGDFLVVWQGQTGGIKDARIFGQFVGTAGNLVGPQLRVSQGHSLSQAHISPSVAPLPSGRFLVAWMDWKDIFPLGLFGVEIDGLGAAVAEEVQINNRRLTSHFRTSLAAGPNGEIFMPYEAYRTNGPGISARRVASE